MTLSRRDFVGIVGIGAAGLASRPATAAPDDIDPASFKGRSVWELPTPALLIDLDAMEANLDRMADLYRERPAELRPHGKTHKCPIIARQQLVRGAVGICAAKVSEAAVFVEDGIDNVLITSPVVTPERIDRVVELTRRSRGVQIVVDRASNVEDYARAATAAGIEFSLVVDLDMGTHRTGIDPAAADQLARAIVDAPGLTFGGLQAYAGHLMHVEGFTDRKARSEAALAPAVACKRRLEDAGIAVPMLSVGGTGTYNVDGDIDGVTDVQVGSYLFMDVNYRAVGGINGPVFDDFTPSLFVLATAISQPAEGRITIDAGYKAFAADQQPPEPLEESGVTYRWGGDEHGILLFDDPSRDLSVGDKLRLIASHCDPTVNLYDH